MGTEEDREEGFFIRREADEFRAAALITLPSPSLVPLSRKKILQQVVKTSKVSKSSLNLALIFAQDGCARVSVQLC